LKNQLNNPEGCHSWRKLLMKIHILNSPFVLRQGRKTQISFCVSLSQVEMFEKLFTFSKGCGNKMREEKENMGLPYRQ
jgi:hypothetical protein